MNPRECGADTRTECLTGSGARARLGRDGFRETTER